MVGLIIVSSPASQRASASVGRHHSACTASRPSTTGSAPAGARATKKAVSYRLTLGMGVTQRATGHRSDKSTWTPAIATRSASDAAPDSRSRRRDTRSAATSGSPIPMVIPTSSMVSRTAAIRYERGSSILGRSPTSPEDRSTHRGSRSPSSTAPPGNSVWPATNVESSVRRRARTCRSGRSSRSTTVAAERIGTPSTGRSSRWGPAVRCSDPPPTTRRS